MSTARSLPAALPEPAGAALGGAGAPGVLERNEVLLVGKVSAVEEPRVLPSGDVLLGFRVVVGRPAHARRAGSRAAKVDVLDCQATMPRGRRTVAALRPGDLVEVQGSLRRRFFRYGGGLGSRYEVEATAVRRRGRPLR